MKFSKFVVYIMVHGLISSINPNFHIIFKEENTNFIVPQYYICTFISYSIHKKHPLTGKVISGHFYEQSYTPICT